MIFPVDQNLNLNNFPNIHDELDQGINLWPLSKNLLKEILDDHISDRFVSQLIWERLGYNPCIGVENPWIAGSYTPTDWYEKFPIAPEVIAHRPASVFLTRSIPKNHKQLLKERLNFPGYRINELYPRRTRRAIAVNWLLAWLEQTGGKLVDNSKLPPLLGTPQDPTKGHPGDLQVE